MFVVQSRGYWYPCFLLEKSIFSPLSDRLFAIAGCRGFAAGRPPLQGCVSEQGYQLRECFAAVAACVLFFGAEFGGGLIQFGHQEMWIVTEAVAAARREDNVSFPAAVCNQWRGIIGMTHQYEHGVITRAAFFFRHITQLFHQQGIVLFVGGIGTGKTG